MECVITCAYSDTQMPYQMHYHTAHEIIFVHSGIVEFSIDQRIYRVNAGNLIFISGLEEHKTHIIQSPYLRYYALFTSAQLSMILDDPRLRSVFLSRSSEFVHIFPVQPIFNEVERLFIQITEEIRTDHEFRNDIIASSFKELMIRCYRLNPHYFPRSVYKINPVILEVQRYIDDHISEKLSIQDLATSFFISESYLSHEFKAWTGYSPQRYLILSRISLARELLSMQKYSVDTVAQQCGFRTTSQFIHCFKKETGTTPGKFMRHIYTAD